MDISDFSFSVLTADHNKNLDCGDPDLNDFFNNNAIKYQDELLAKTFLWYNSNLTVGFISLLNDSIELKMRQKKQRLPKEKYFKYYPAVKIGRLGINKEYQCNNLGSQILQFIKTFMIVKNKTGCRFITIDGYNKEKVLNFYLKNGFKFYTENDKL